MDSHSPPLARSDVGIPATGLVQYRLVRSLNQCHRADALARRGFQRITTWRILSAQLVKHQRHERFRFASMSRSSSQSAERRQRIAVVFDKSLKG